MAPRPLGEGRDPPTLPTPADEHSNRGRTPGLLPQSGPVGVVLVSPWFLQGTSWLVARWRMNTGRERRATPREPSGLRRPGRDVAGAAARTGNRSSLRSGCKSVLLVLAAVLTDCKCPFQPVQPLQSRGLRPGNSCTQDPRQLGSSQDFSGLAARVDRLPSGKARKLRQQPKQQRGRGELATHREHPRPPHTSRTRRKTT